MGKKKQHGGKREGAGRKPSSPEGSTIAVAASIPKELIAELNALADKHGWNRSQAVTEAIRGLIARK